ncbi:hypothetical protein FRC10_010433 [Ceratobasidium sp. 414]|nr:hypothetical protein FRC10_010433 [Ceratobasidium sp. 414]
MANNGTNGQEPNGIEGNPAFPVEANPSVPAGLAPQNIQDAPAPAQIAGHEQAGVAPANPMPEALWAQGLASEPAQELAQEPVQESAPETAPEPAPVLAPMPIADDGVEDSPLTGSLAGLEHILSGDEENA